MATINASLPTLLDQVKRTAPGGSIDDIVESLTVLNPMLQDAVFLEGNLPTGHRYTSRTALPSTSWRRLNEGVAPGKSATDQFDEQCGMMEMLSVVDVKVAALNGNAAAFRASEDAAFVQAMSNELQTAFIYHSTATAPEKINGLAPRLNSISAGTAYNQCLACDGSPSGSDQTSVWLVGWGPQGVFGIYPKGSTVGLQQKDLGTQLWTDSGGTNKFEAYVTKFSWDVGLCVKDYRKLVRICNIDTSAIASNGTNVIEAMIKAYHQIDRTGVRLAWYCNRKIGTYLHLQARNQVTNSTLTIENVGGQPVTYFLGIPVREVDAILNTEAVLS